VASVSFATRHVWMFCKQVDAGRRSGLCFDYDRLAPRSDRLRGSWIRNRKGR